MTNVQSELEARTRDFVAAVAEAVKKATLEGVAEVLRRDHEATRHAPVEDDALVAAEIEASDVEPEPDVAPLPSKSLPKPPSPAADRVSFYIKAKPGLRAEEIRAALGLDKDDMQKAIKVLLGKGKITKEGELRGTRYRPASG